MAKTTELGKVGRFIRKELGKDYPGHTFADHRFDAVSEDNSIIASIKSHSWLTSGGNLPSGKIGQIYQALYFLSLVDAKTKLLILTDREAYEGFLRESDGKVADGIEIKFYLLSPELQVLVTEVHQKASRGMSREQKFVSQ